MCAIDDKKRQLLLIKFCSKELARDKQEETFTLPMLVATESSITASCETRTKVQAETLPWQHFITCGSTAVRRKSVWLQELGWQDETAGMSRVGQATEPPLTRLAETECTGKERGEAVESGAGKREPVSRVRHHV